jgi:hypothetical protein
MFRVKLKRKQSRQQWILLQPSKKLFSSIRREILRFTVKFVVWLERRCTNRTRFLLQKHLFIREKNQRRCHNVKSECDLHWCNILLKKFKKSVASTLNYLITEKYILDDVKANRNIPSFVFQIMRHVKTINIIDLHEQLTWTYNVIVSKLIKNIDSFDENIFTMIFLKNLKTKKNTWHRIYNRKLNISRIEFESFQYQINFSNLSFFAYEQTIYTQKQYHSSLENVSEQRNYQRF